MTGNLQFLKINLKEFSPKPMADFLKFVDISASLIFWHTAFRTTSSIKSLLVYIAYFSVFGTPWQFGGTFTSRGGVMQAKDSDVCLMVVPNAVHKGEYVHIYGAIFTDTTEIRKKVGSGFLFLFISCACADVAAILLP